MRVFLVVAFVSCFIFANEKHTISDFCANLGDFKGAFVSPVADFTPIVNATLMQKSTIYAYLKRPFDARFALVQDFFTPKKPPKPRPKYDFISAIKPQFLPTQSPNITIKGRGRTKTGMLLNDILLDSTQNRLLNSSSASEVSISQGYLLPLDSPLLEKLEFVGGYTMISNTQHKINAQFGSDIGLWNFQFGYGFSNTDLSSLATNALNLDSHYTNHLFRAKFGLNSGESHKYSLNFTDQKGEKRGLLTSDGEVENVWNSPQYDKISAYILGNSKFNERVFLKSKFYYDSFLNIAKIERIWGDSALYAKPYSNITNNHSFGFVETLRFAFDENIDFRVGVNLKSDNRKYTSTTLNANGELLTNLNDYNDLYTTIFAEYSHAFGDRARFVINGSYDRNDSLKSITNNATADNISLDGWTLQGILYVDISKYVVLYLNAMKNSLVPTSKEIRTSTCGARTMNPYSLQSTFVYGLGTCAKW